MPAEGNKKGPAADSGFTPKPQRYTGLQEECAHPYTSYSCR
jgi:hypothetical protein